MRFIGSQGTFVSYDLNLSLFSITIFSGAMVITLEGNIQHLVASLAEKASEGLLKPDLVGYVVGIHPHLSHRIE